MYNEFLLKIENIEPCFSDEYLAQILAIVYVNGGSNENIVFDKTLNSIIILAQKRFNIDGGLIPTKRGIILIKKYVGELNQKTLPNWAISIYKKYNFYEGKNKK